MPRWLRWTGYGLLGVSGLIVVAVAALYLVTSLRFRRTYAFPDSPVRAAADSAALTRGKHLVEAIGKCQVCHGVDYAGKVLADSPVFARLASGNLTTGRGGIAGYTDTDFERAIRHGVRRDGRPLFFMPAEAFAVLSDEDLGAMIGYLRTLPPVDRENPAPRIGPVARMLYLGGKFPLLPVELVRHEERRPAPPPGESVEYGQKIPRFARDDSASSRLPARLPVRPPALPPRRPPSSFPCLSPPSAPPRARPLHQR